MINTLTATAPPSARSRLLVRATVNLAGAIGAAFFARASLDFYLHTHRLIGAVFFVEQMWFVGANIIRRPATVVTRRLGDWLLAFGGTFGGVLLRPDGAHSQWGVEVGLGLQLLGLAICIPALFALGRSFGLAPADRGLVKRGPYALVRHPLYAGYLLTQSGYLLQSMSLRNVVVIVAALGCNVGRALAEERLLGQSGAYASYDQKVRWRFVPGVW